MRLKDWGYWLINVFPAPGSRAVGVCTDRDVDASASCVRVQLPMVVLCVSLSLVLSIVQLLLVSNETFRAMLKKIDSFSSKRCLGHIPPSLGSNGSIWSYTCS